MKTELDVTMRGDTKIILEKERLTDGSHAYNVILVGDMGRVKVEIPATEYKHARDLYFDLISQAKFVSIEIDSIRG